MTFLLHPARQIRQHAKTYVLDLEGTLTRHDLFFMLDLGSRYGSHEKTLRCGTTAYEAVKKVVGGFVGLVDDEGVHLLGAFGAWSVLRDPTIGFDEILLDDPWHEPHAVEKAFMQVRHAAVADTWREDTTGNQDCGGVSLGL